MSYSAGYRKSREYALSHIRHSWLLLAMDAGLIVVSMALLKLSRAQFVIGLGGGCIVGAFMFAFFWTGKPFLHVLMLFVSLPGACLFVTELSDAIPMSAVLGLVGAVYFPYLVLISVFKKPLTKRIVAAIANAPEQQPSDLSN